MIKNIYRDIPYSIKKPSITITYRIKKYFIQYS